MKKSAIRVEGKSKLVGSAKFIDDITFPDILYGTTIRSPVARGLLKKIEFFDGIPWSEFVIVTAKDIPGNNYVAVIEKDWPFLVDEKINHANEPILLLAHPDKHLVERAKKFVKLTIEELPSVLTIKDSLEQKNIIWGKDNIIKYYDMYKGDVDKAFKEADIVVSHEYHTGAQEQLYIETNGVIAIASPDKSVTVWGSMQCPYYIHGALTTLFNYPKEKVRIIQVETGGGFGGKEDYPSILAGHAALLSYKADGRPVKMVYSRAEDLAVTTKRHPSQTTYKTALSKDGKILGIDIEFFIDAGAYATLSQVVLSRGMIHATGPYYCPNIRIIAKALATNHPPNGAFRGFGAPQSIFACEKHMDNCAKKLGISAEDFRKINFIKNGSEMGTGQIINENVDMKKLLDIALKKSDYHKKVKDFSLLNKKNTNIKKGIGFSAFMHGGGFTGGGEKYLASIVGISMDKSQKIKILASSTEMGQGKNTVFSQIASDALGINIEHVEVPFPDTSVVPNSGPTVASRTTMVVGKLVENAAIGMKNILIDSGLLKKKYNEKEFFVAANKYMELFGDLKCFIQYKHPDYIKWSDETHLGDAYATYAWAVYVAEVSVDTRTYQSSVDNFYAVQEVGNVVNETLATGQIQGGVAQGVGYAIMENVILKDGRMHNNQLTNYIIPTSHDIPNIKVYFEEWNKKFGPGGAKGIGELPLDGPAPAVINAVSFATNLEINHIPLMPEDLMTLMEAKQ